jgi:hypothetical protein
MAQEVLVARRPVDSSRGPEKLQVLEIAHQEAIFSEQDPGAGDAGQRDDVRVVRSAPATFRDPGLLLANGLIIFEHRAPGSPQLGPKPQ